MKKKNANRKIESFLLPLFLLVAFVFALFCCIAYFGDVNMFQTKGKIIISIFIGIVAITAILCVIFMSPTRYDYSNVQYIEGSNIGVIYTDEKKERKICLVQYYDKSNLPTLVNNLSENTIIYVSQDTPIDKEFFESLKNVDYCIRFPHSSAKIEIKN